MSSDILQEDVLLGDRRIWHRANVCLYLSGAEYIESGELGDYAAWFVLILVRSLQGLERMSTDFMKGRTAFHECLCVYGYGENGVELHCGSEDLQSHGMETRYLLCCA